MPYDPTKPQGTDKIPISQKQLLANFESLEKNFAQDHYTWTNPNGLEGSHKWLQLPEQSSDPTTLADELALYTKDVGGSTELFTRKESNGAVNQITNSGGGVYPATASVMGYWDRNGVLLGPNNGIASVTLNSATAPTGWDVIFTTPQADTDYLAMAGSIFGSSPIINDTQEYGVANQTTTGLRVIAQPSPQGVSFLVVMRL